MATGSSIDIEPPASGRPSGLDEIHGHDDVQPMPFNSAQFEVKKRAATSVEDRSRLLLLPPSVDFS